MKFGKNFPRPKVFKGLFTTPVFHVVLSYVPSKQSMHRMQNALYYVFVIITISIINVTSIMVITITTVKVYRVETSGLELAVATFF